MKTRFNSNEIAHQWAHQLAPSGKCSQSKSFNGRSFYSYAAEIGRIIERKGKKAYVLNLHNYSATTSKHQNDMRYAIPEGELVFRFDGEIEKAVKGRVLLDYSLKQAADCVVKSERAVSRKDFYIAEQAGWLKQAQKVNEYFGLRRKVDTKSIDRMQSKIKAEHQRQLKAERDRQAKIEKENAEFVQHWLAGQMVNFPSAINRVYLRRIQLDESGERVFNGGIAHMETSKGVRVPLTDAERAFRFSMTRRSKGWKRNGEQCPVGQYQIDSVTSEGIIAGCHRITWTEAERFAKQQGWI